MLTGALRSALVVMLVVAVLQQPRALAQVPETEVQAFAALVKNGTVADRIVPDFVVKFRIPLDVRWSVIPVTDRAKATFAKSAAKARTVSDETIITVIAGGRARHAGGYGRRNAWTYANELTVRYDRRIR